MRCPRPFASVPNAADAPPTSVRIACYAARELAARAYDRVQIAAVGRGAALVRTNYPAADYFEEFAFLEGLGLDGALAHIKAAAQKSAAVADRRQRLSSYRGVTKYKSKKQRRRPWKASVTLSGAGSRYVGCFSTEVAAARAHDRAAIAACGHGEAVLNFPAGEYRAEWAALRALGLERAIQHVKETTPGSARPSGSSPASEAPPADEGEGGGKPALRAKEKRPRGKACLVSAAKTTEGPTR